MFLFLQQHPVVVDLTKQPPPTPDITMDVYMAMFAMAGIFLLVAVVGSGLVAGGMLLYKRWRDSSAAPTQSPHTHTSLGI